MSNLHKRSPSDTLHFNHAQFAFEVVILSVDCDALQAYLYLRVVSLIASMEMGLPGAEI